MKKCPYCKIEVGGTSTKCPFCQSSLQGEGGLPHWPAQTTLQKQSVFYKIQLFLVLTGMIVALSLDFLFSIRYSSLHWSLLISLWLISFEYGLVRLFKKEYSTSRILTLLVISLCVLLLITSYFTGYWAVIAGIVVPIMCMGTLIANFILILVDQIANAMVYLLSNILLGIMPYLVLFAMGKDIPVAWVLCLMTSVIILIGTCVFRGRGVLSELQRRFHM